MAARVVTLNSSAWAGSKPADYKGKELDNALKAYETLVGKEIKVPKGQIPEVKKVSNAAVDAAITQLRAIITEFEKTKVSITQLVNAAKLVQASAAKASADLLKLGKGKPDEQAYKSAASEATSIGSVAANAVKDYQ